MAASMVRSLRIFRLAKYVRNIPEGKSIYARKCQSHSRRPHMSALAAIQCRTYADSVPPHFYPYPQEVKEGEPKTGIEVSTAEWKYVERLIPPLEPPPVPKHESYPTPSGFIPPTGASADTPYHIRRTKYHNLPVFRRSEANSTRQLTVVTKIDGDIWALAGELKDHLESTCDAIDLEIPMQVIEYSKKIYFKGIFTDEISDYIRDKGF